MQPKGPLILVVDDDESNLKIIGNTLKALDVRMILSASGRETLNLLETVLPDLIILDILMPGMNGFQLCKKLSYKKRTREIPIIFLSAKNDLNTVTQCFSMGGRDYITKPFAKEELLSRVKTQLDLKAKEDSLKKINGDLERLVEERTSELKASNQKLEDYNTALKVLLEKRDQDKDALANSVIFNARELILPWLEKLKERDMDDIQRQEIVSMCMGNVEEIISPFARDLKKKIDAMGFTTKEMTIANFISQGKSTQEISLVLNSSESTINYHRNNIRKKLGLKNKTQNLEIYLKRLEN